MANYQSQLQKAQALIKAKKKAEARTVLLNILQKDETVVEAYVLWAAAAATPDEAREALEEALRFDPKNTGIQKRLQQINEKYPPQPKKDVLVPLGADAQNGGRGPHSDAEAALEDALRPAAQRKSKPQKKGGISATAIMVGGVIIVLVGAIVVLILTQIQIGPCYAQEWLVRYNEARQGMVKAQEQLLALASMGKDASAEALEARYAKMREYRAAIYNLGGQPCVKGVRNATLAWIDASISLAEKLARGGPAPQDLSEQVRNAERDYKQALVELSKVET
ncbi:MAG: hypothetical protein JXB47_15860 [Anaerolineae bacterium]|nr:hypothetical protein [Anaerolineae bacterium]